MQPHYQYPHGLAREHPDARIHRASPDLYERGIVEAKSPGGGTVKAYCADRAVVDLIFQRASEGGGPPARPRRGRGLFQTERRRPVRTRPKGHHGHGHDGDRYDACLVLAYVLAGARVHEGKVREPVRDGEADAFPVLAVVEKMTVLAGLKSGG